MDLIELPLTVDSEKDRGRQTTKEPEVRGQRSDDRNPRSAWPGGQSFIFFLLHFNLQSNKLSLILKTVHLKTII